MSREHIPNQNFGRGLRINTGVGNLAQTKYLNNLENYLSMYPIDYEIDKNVMVETIKIANRLDIWYPKGLEKRIRDVRPTKVDVWTDAVKSFRKKYCNSIEEGHKWMHEFTNTPEIPTLPFDLSIQVPCNGKMIEVNLNDQMKEWKGDGTLDKFFNLV